MAKCEGENDPLYDSPVGINAWPVPSHHRACRYTGSSQCQVTKKRSTGKGKSVYVQISLAIMVFTYFWSTGDVLVSICRKFAKSRHVVQRCISTLSPGSSLFGSIREIHVFWVQKTDHIWLECQDKNTRWLWNFVTRFSNWPWNIPWTTPNQNMSQLLSKKRPILT